MSLPPGQHAIRYFPQFGFHYSEPRLLIGEPAMIQVEGAVARRLEVPVSHLAELKRSLPTFIASPDGRCKIYIGVV